MYTHYLDYLFNIILIIEQYHVSELGTIHLANCFKFVNYK